DWSDRTLTLTRTSEMSLPLTSRRRVGPKDAHGTPARATRGLSGAVHWAGRSWIRCRPPTSLDRVGADRLRGPGSGAPGARTRADRDIQELDLSRSFGDRRRASAGRQSQGVWPLTGIALGRMRPRHSSA